MALVIRRRSGIGRPVVSSRLRNALFAAGSVLFVAAVLFAVNRAPDGEVGAVRRLLDGSTLELRQVIFADGYQYKHQSGNRFVRLVAPIMPAFIRNRFFPSFSGSFGFGGDGNTNLI